MTVDEINKVEKLEADDSVLTAAAGIQTEPYSLPELEVLERQLDEKTQHIINLEDKVQTLTARVENESFAFDAALEVAEENQKKVDDLQQQLDEQTEDTLAVEKMCEGLTEYISDLETEVAVVVRQTEQQKSDNDHVKACFGTALEELRVKDEEFVELQDQMAELEGQNKGLAKIMARDREEGAYYMRRAQDMAGLLEGRPMAEEDRKLLEEKDKEVRTLREHIGEIDVKKEELEGKLTMQQVIIDTELPALRTELKGKEQDLALETSRTDAFKYVHFLKADVLRSFQPDEAVHAMKTEQNLLRTDNRHLTEKVQKLEKDMADIKASEETSQGQFAAVSVENSDLRELIKTMEETTQFLEVDVGRLTWQLDVKADALDRADKEFQATIGELEGTIDALNHEVDVANDTIRETEQSATQFASLPAETQDQVRLQMMNEELRTIKENLEPLMQKLTEDQASLDELKKENEDLKQRNEDFKWKETQAILREPHEEWAREELQKRLLDAETAVGDLRKELEARDEQIQSLHEHIATIPAAQTELTKSANQPPMTLGSMHFDSPPQRRDSGDQAGRPSQRTEAVNHNDHGEETEGDRVNAFDFGFDFSFRNTAFREERIVNPSVEGRPVRTWEIGLGSVFRSKLASSSWLG